MVGGAIDHAEPQAPLRHGQRRELPVADMRGEEDSRPVVIAQAVDVLGAGDREPLILVDTDPVQPRKFRPDPPEIVPNALYHVGDLALRLFGIDAAEIAVGRSRLPPAGPDEAGDEAAGGGGEIEGEDGQQPIGQSDRRRLGPRKEMLRPHAA